MAELTITFALVWFLNQIDDFDSVVDAEGVDAIDL